MKLNTDNKDSILAITLLLLLLFLYSRQLNFIFAALILIVVSLLSKQAAGFFDTLWKKGTQFLGVISSSIILSVLFFCIVFPLGLIIKLAGKSSLLLRYENIRTTFVIRKKLFTNNDLQNPF